MNTEIHFSEEDWDEIQKCAYNASYRMNHETFMDKLKLQNEHFNDIIIFAKDKISCKCRKCGHQWKTAASELLKGTGCPVCQIKAVGEKRSKKQLILDWRKKNPNGTKKQCESTIFSTDTSS